MFFADIRRLLLPQVFVWMLVASPTFGQAAPPKPMTEAEFVELIQSRLKQVEELRDLDETTKAKIRDFYRQAEQEMQSARTWSAKAAHAEKLAASAPVEIGQTRSELAVLPAKPAPLPDNIGLPQLEQMVSKREAELERWRTELATVESELKSRAVRRVDPKQVNNARERLTDVNTELQTPATGEDALPLGMARRAMLFAKRRSAEQEILCYEKESAAYEARTDLLPLLRDLNTRHIDLATEEVKQWREAVNGRRQQEAEQQVKRASWEASQADQAVRPLVERNAKLAEMRKTLASDMIDSNRLLEEAKQKLKGLVEQDKRVRDRVEIAEKTKTTNTIGLWLQKQRTGLPNLREYRRNISARQQMMGEGQMELLQLNENSKALANLDLRTQEELQSLELTPQSGDRAELETAVREALKTEKDYLDAYLKDHDKYDKNLEDLTSVEQQLIDKTELCAQYIDERVLWIASTGWFSSSDIHRACDALWWLAGPDAWVEYGKTIYADVIQNPAMTTLALAAFLLLLYWRMKFRVRIQEIGEKAAKGTCCSFPPTLEVAMLTVLVAACWPGLMWYVGWRLINAAEARELCKVMGIGLTETSVVFLALKLLWHVCCPRGLAESHFGWSAGALKLLRQNIRWFSPPALLLMCVAVAMAWQEKNDRWDSSLGRMSFIAALLCLSLVMHRVLRPASVVFQAMVASRRGGWFDRFRYAWYSLIVLTPAALAVLAAVGYHYTARQLVTRLILTMYVLVGGVVCRAILLRWTMVNQRRLSIEQARQRRAAAQLENNHIEDAAARPVPAKPDRDLATINTQTRRLVEYSLAVACALAIWCAWIDVLPALGVLNRVTVWNTTTTVADSIPAVGSSAVAAATGVATTSADGAASDGKTVSKTSERQVAITLANLCLAMLILATCVMAAKNIPGLLEMAVLQHLPMDAGMRYAVATVSRYLISIVGLLLCFGELGVGWSKVQWLVAAMSLGLGFGLQEIFANFVSGLIILFERPVRVGDVVTIDTISGVVSRIRIRATTITDWDRKELIIPNKEFITGRVLNWTLTDHMNRVVVKVGVAYGTDTAKASAILQRLAQDNPHVLKDPMPQVMLDSFGDSALNFVLTCYLPNLENRGKVINDLHIAIDREFRQAGIDIAFPQREVHVRGLEIPLPILQPNAAKGVPWQSAPRPTPVDKVA